MYEFLERVKLFENEKVIINVFYDGECYTFANYDLLIEYFIKNRKFYILDFYTFEYDSLEKRLEINMYIK